MDRSYQMRWSKCEGTVYSENRIWKAFCELTEIDGTTQWFCKTEKVDNWDSSFEREFFEVGKLEQAYKWCKSKMMEYDEIKTT